MKSTDPTLNVKVGENHRIVGADDEVSGANFTRRNRLHLVSKDQRGRRKLLVAEIGNGIAAAENAGLVAVNVFHHHIISQASIYQYVMGFQGAARDPLQHSLPFIFSDPQIVKEVLQYSLKEVRADGSIPYGIVGHGMPMPTISDNSSDMPLWLLWVTSEYVLATRDITFLDAKVVPIYGVRAEGETVRNLLTRCYRHLVDDVKTGQHGLIRMLRDDWNDALENAWVPQPSQQECLEKGESVLNSAMAAYVFDYYATMLIYTGVDAKFASEVRQKAEDHRDAVQKQWTGKWNLGPRLPAECGLR